MLTAKTDHDVLSSQETGKTHLPECLLLRPQNKKNNKSVHTFKNTGGKWEGSDG